MTEYLHVVIESPDSKGPLFLYGDFSERDLRRKFLRNYQLGKSVMKDSQVVDLSKITSVKIIKTSVTLDAALEQLQKDSNERIDRLNRESSSLAIVSPGRGWKQEHITECGEEVTDKYISEPPGQGTWLTSLSTILGNPWVLSIGGGLVLLVLGAIVKKWFGL